jgi:hypothetical protein
MQIARERESGAGVAVPFFLSLFSRRRDRFKVSNAPHFRIGQSKTEFWTVKFLQIHSPTQIQTQTFQVANRTLYYLRSTLTDWIASVISILTVVPPITGDGEGRPWRWTPPREKSEWITRRHVCDFPLKQGTDTQRSSMDSASTQRRRVKSWVLLRRDFSHKWEHLAKLALLSTSGRRPPEKFAQTSMVAICCEIAPFPRITGQLQMWPSFWFKFVDYAWTSDDAPFFYKSRVVISTFFAEKGNQTTRI